MNEYMPFIPENIVVHLGFPTENAENVTVSFREYIKNVASSEIYPTWPESAIRANIYAQITYALNRIYTEWYRSRGYDFDITNTTQFDQAFVKDREIFENISVIVDDIIDSYVVKQGSIEPYFTQYCNGTTSTCPGLSQWGTVDLANSGLVPYEILQYYYGKDLDIVTNVPFKGNSPSYPGYPLRRGIGNNDVKRIQNQLNRIRNNFPSIPSIKNANGVFDENTEATVKKFQQVFGLVEDGIVGKITWYKINAIYTAVKKLGELSSEGVKLQDIEVPFESSFKLGSNGAGVKTLQYYLDVVGFFNDAIPSVPNDGIFDNATEKSVKAFQKLYGLTEDGVVGRDTWNALVSAYSDTLKALPKNYQGDKAKIYPGYILTRGAMGENVVDVQNYLNVISNTYTAIPKINADGIFGEETEVAVKAFQSLFELPVDGYVTAPTWQKIAEIYDATNRLF